MASVAAKMRLGFRPMRYLAALVVLMLAGCGGTGSGSGSGNYTKITGSTGSCGNHDLTVGEQVEVVLRIHNASGHPWRSSWIWLQGDGDFRIDSMSMNGQSADSTYRSAAQWELGHLAAGRVGRTIIDMTAKKTGAPEVHFAAWGSSDSRGSSPSIPDNLREIVCNYGIHP